MRYIVRVFKYEELQLIAGEWELMPVTEKQVVNECDTLEEALESLGLYKSNAGEFDTYHITYDSEEELEDWETDWLNECALLDRQYRAELARKRRSITPFDEEWDDIEDELIAELEEVEFEMPWDYEYED